MGSFPALFLLSGIAFTVTNQQYLERETRLELATLSLEG
jgi:hypothetical protein